MSLTSTHVNYLVWRYLQEAGHAKTAARLQREWGISDPERLPFSQGVKSRALVQLVQKGLSFIELELEARENKKSEHSKIGLFFGTDETTYPASPSPPPAPVVLPPPPKFVPSTRKAPPSAAQSPSKRVRKQFKSIASGLESENASRTGTPLRSVGLPAGAQTEDYFGMAERDVDMTDADGDADADGEPEDAESTATPRTQSLIERTQTAPRERTPPPAPPPKIPTLVSGTSSAVQTEPIPEPKIEEVSVKTEQVLPLVAKEGESALLAWAPIRDGMVDSASQTEPSRSRRILATASGSKCQLWYFPSPSTSPESNPDGDTTMSDALAPQSEKLVSATVITPQDCAIDSLAWSPMGSILAVTSCQRDSVFASDPTLFQRACVISLIESSGSRDYDVPVVLSNVFKTTWSHDSTRLLVIGLSPSARQVYDDAEPQARASDERSVFCILNTVDKRIYEVASHDALLEDVSWLDDTRYLAVGQHAVVIGDLDAPATDDGAPERNKLQDVVVSGDSAHLLRKYHWKKSFVDPTLSLPLTDAQKSSTVSTKRRAVMFCQDERALAILNLDLQNPSAATIQVTENAHEAYISAVELSTPKATSTGPQSILFTASLDGNVRIWGLPTFENSSSGTSSLTLLRQFTTQTPTTPAVQPLALSFSQSTNSLAVAALSDVLIFDIDIAAEDLGLQTRESSEGEEESIPSRMWKLSPPDPVEKTEEASATDKPKEEPTVKIEGETRVIAATDADPMDVDVDVQNPSNPNPETSTDPARATDQSSAPTATTRQEAQPQAQSGPQTQARNPTPNPAPSAPRDSTLAQSTTPAMPSLLPEVSSPTIPLVPGLHHHLAWDAAGRQLAFGSVGGTVKVVELRIA